MALAVQQSLLDAGGGTPMAESARWIEGVMLGEIALGLCVIAVAVIGALMLTGRLPLRQGARIMAGSFVLLGAPVIASGFVGGGGRGRARVSAAIGPAPPTSTRPVCPATAPMALARPCAI